MDSKENIDRLFQEKLEGMEATPNPEVWSAIEAKLKKKKRRVLPMWWMYAGAASVIIAGFLLYPFLKTDKPIINDVIVTSPKRTKDSMQIHKSIPVLPIQEEKTVIAKSSNTPRKRQPKQNSASIKNLTQNTNLIASENSTLDKAVKEGSLSEEKNAMEKISFEKKTQNNSVKISSKNDSTSTKKSIKKDFLKELEKRDSVLVAATKDNKWSVSPTFALTHTNSFTNTSALDKSLNASDTNGENTFSYGVKLAYEVTNKWTVQSGVFVQKIGYSNSNLSVLNNVRGASLENVEHNSEPAFLLSTSETALDANSLSTSRVETTRASLQQNYSYIEIPVEVKYTFLESKKFSSQIVTGVSSLFLNQNEVILSSETQSQSLGKASNLNTINFSGNLGIDLQYSINKKLKIAINPMFKVQLNTFSKNDNGFRPYTIGVHSGLIYQF
ncbi:Outer membrane protein beta-barrel domain-containing protein [Tenacibaculum sp. MAR_2009_124]|uniref:outer membrane beta-barrel protein n=1 Tax=Tenacibaculum sp. MAR_2009_124 TaxID=1250059 RepID=UPI00089B5404|nr:outer membrane beta-barrel protein [Tenacibaculum sp. MAR_2009_124]SEC48018.1 Outer membrane protein beta-barrel domain-containing protein [Tenacibaculum sp. MAR_2009_124]